MKRSVSVLTSNVHYYDIVGTRTPQAEILSRLSHPNVITFYGVCMDKYPEYFIITGR